MLKRLLQHFVNATLRTVIFKENDENVIKCSEIGCHLLMILDVGSAIELDLTYPT
jgi:hypothetical protein